MQYIIKDLDWAVEETSEGTVFDEVNEEAGVMPVSVEEVIVVGLDIFRFNITFTTKEDAVQFLLWYTDEDDTNLVPIDWIEEVHA